MKKLLILLAICMGNAIQAMDIAATSDSAEASQITSDPEVDTLVAYWETFTYSGSRQPISSQLKKELKTLWLDKHPANAQTSSNKPVLNTWQQILLSHAKQLDALSRNRKMPLMIIEYKDNIYFAYKDYSGNYFLFNNRIEFEELKRIMYDKSYGLRCNGNVHTLGRSDNPTEYFVFVQIAGRCQTFKGLLTKISPAERQTFGRPIEKPNSFAIVD